MAAVSKLFPTATRLLYYDTMEDMRKAALSSCIVFVILHHIGLLTQLIDMF